MTGALVFALGLIAALATDLASAFEVAGCTAGVVVCFCLPGATPPAAPLRLASLHQSRQLRAALYRSDEAESLPRASSA